MTTYSPAALLDSLAGGLTKAGLLRPAPAVYRSPSIVVYRFKVLSRSNLVAVKRAPHV